MLKKILSLDIHILFVKFTIVKYIKDAKSVQLLLSHRNLPTFTASCVVDLEMLQIIWTASSEIGTYRLCEQWRFRRACASAQSRQNLRCSLIQAVNQEEPSDRKPNPWPHWMAGHAQLKFVMTECSKTHIRLTGLIFSGQPAGWLTRDMTCTALTATFSCCVISAFHFV